MEHGILFKDRLVRAILEGRKTQTRRIVKPQPTESWATIVGRYNPTLIRRSMEEPGQDAFGASDEYTGRISPYGEPGDFLWVRETWHKARDGQLCFRATGCRGEFDIADGNKWKPGIHLFRKDARLILEISSVEIQRLQDISKEDAIAEGLSQQGQVWMGAEGFLNANPILAFRSLWDSINAKRSGASWSDNPWVWVINFKKVES